MDYSSWHRKQAYAMNKLAEDRLRCKKCHHLLDQSGECWFCHKVDREIRRRFKAGKS